MSYAAPNGSPTGSGTSSDPWDLATFLLRKVEGCLKGGVYQLAGNWQITGTTPFVVTSCQGEWAVLDGRLSPRTTVLRLAGDNIEIRNLEITNTDPTRIVDTDSGGRGNAIQDDGRSNRVINCVIHDAGQGIVSQTGGESAIYYGNVIYNNGWSRQAGMKGGNGHGFYLQNQYATAKVVSNNIVFGNFNNGIDMHSSTPGKARSLYLDANVTTLDRTKLQGSGVTTDTLELKRHFSFQSETNFLSGSYNLLLEDSFLMDALPIRMTNWTGPITWRSNQIVNMPGTSGALFTWDLQVGQTPSGTFSGNTYWQGRTQVPGINIFPGGALSFAQWQAKGFDLDSTLRYGQQPPTQMFYLPNSYQPDRAHIIVYNNDGLTQIMVDAHLLMGQKFTIRNGLNYGQVLYGGFYNGPFPLDVPATMAQVLGDPAKTRQATQKFAVLIIEPN